MIKGSLNETHARPCSISLAFEAKRALTARQSRMDRPKMTRLRHFTKCLIWLVVPAEKFELLNRKNYKKLVFVVSNTNHRFAFVASRASRHGSGREGNPVVARICQAANEMV